jgi:hypothetical protein
MVTNPWLSARSSEQYSAVPGSLQPPTGPRNYQPGRRWFNYQLNNQNLNHHQPQHRRQQAEQQQRNPQKSKAQQSNPEQSKPNPPKPEQPGKSSSHDQKGSKNQPKTNQSATHQSHQQPQNRVQSNRPSNDQPTTPTPNNQRGKKKKKDRRQEGDVTSPPRKLLKARRRRERQKEKRMNQLDAIEELGETQNPSEQNEGGQPTDPNVRRPLRLKEEESDTEHPSSLSARFQPMTTDDNPETSAGVRADDAPRRWENHPLPTEARVGEQHGSMSTSFEARPFPRSPSYGTCAFESPPPFRESNQTSQPIDHGAPTITSAPGEVPPETSALARAIAQEMTDKLHAVHLSITDQFQAQNKEIVDRLEKQSTKQKRRMAKLKKKNKVLADKVDKQTEMVSSSRANQPQTRQAGTDTAPSHTVETAENMDEKALAQGSGGGEH